MDNSIYQTLYQNAPSGIILVDKKSMLILDLNQKAKDQLDDSAVEFQGQSIFEFFNKLSFETQDFRTSFENAWRLITDNSAIDNYSFNCSLNGMEIILLFKNYIEKSLGNIIQITLINLNNQIQNNPLLSGSRSRFALLNELDSAIAKKATPVEIAEITLTKFQTLINFDRGSILSLNSSNNLITILTVKGNRDLGLKNEFEGSEEFIQVLKDGKQIELSTDSTLFMNFRVSKSKDFSDIKKVLITPIKPGDEPIGAINLSINNQKGFSLEEKELCQEIGRRLAISLKQANLVHEMSQWVNQLEAVREATLRLTSMLDLEEVIKIILEASLKLSETAENTHIFLFNQDLEIEFGKSLHVERGFGEAIFSTRSDGLTMTTARGGKPIVVENMQEHQLYKNAPEDWFGAIVGIPLIYQGMVNGVMTMFFNKPQKLEERELQIIYLLADQAAIAIQNARLFSQVSKARELSSALLEMSRSTSSTLDIKGVIRSILSEPKKILPYTSGNVIVFDNDVPTQIIPTHDNFDQDKIDDVIKQLSESPFIRRIQETKEAMLIPSVKDHPDWRVLEDGLLINSWLAVPLIFHDQLIGILSFDHEETNTYNEEHLEVAKAISSEAAVALQNAKLFSEVVKTRELSNTLLEIARTTSSSLDLTNVVRAILSESNKLIPYSSGNVIVYEGQFPIMFIPTKEYDSTELLSNILDLLNETHHFKEIIRTREPYLVKNVIQDPYWQIISNAINIQSWLGVPLIFHDRVIGILSFNHEEENYYTEEHVEISKALSAEAAVALQNALFYKDAQNYADSLEQRVEERTSELEQINQELETFAYSVSHDLRTPLRAMEGFSQALYEDYGDKLDDQGLEYTQRIMEASSRMDALIHDLLEYSRLSMVNMKLQLINTSEMISDSCQLLSEDLANKNAKLTIQRNLPPVFGYEPVLRQVITNLVTNALKFIHPERQPEINIGAENYGNKLRIQITDNGIGVQESYQRKIFEVFERLHNRDDFPGTGIGLAIVKRGIERMGGKVGVESDGITGSTFWIELDRAYE